MSLGEEGPPERGSERGAPLLKGRYSTAIAFARQHHALSRYAITVVWHGSK